MAKSVFKYKTIGPNQEIKYHRNTTELSTFIKRGKGPIREVMLSGTFIDGYRVIELDEPFEYPTPVKDESIIIEGIKCVVINIYDNTFSVMTDLGARLVKLSDITFVGPAIAGVDRQFLLQTKNY